MNLIFLDIQSYSEKSITKKNFINIQMSQYTPTKESGVSRMRTGFERVVAHRTKPPFAYAAEEDGKIVGINAKLGLIAVKYSNGEQYVLNYGQEYTNNGGGGFHVTQNIELNDLKEGQKFKRGDVLLYNKDFFSPDPYSKQVDLNTGVFVNVSLLEVDQTFEDSCILTRDLANRLESYPVQTRVITLDRNTTVHQFAKADTVLKSVDPLIIFDESPIPEEYAVNDDLVDLLKDLNRATPKAKYNGKVVKVEAFYRSELSEMSPSMAATIKTVNKLTNGKTRLAKGADNELDHLGPGVINGDRLGNIEMTEDTVVLKFYIQQTLENEVGDKVVFGGSLKSVCGRVSEDRIATEDEDTVVDGLIAFTSAQNRMIPSILVIGMQNRLLEHIEKEMLDMYFEE